MTLQPQEELKALRDIKGVIGSFIVNDSGGVCASDVPSVLSREALGDVGMRLARIVDALVTAPPMDSLVLRFYEHRLSIRPSAEGTFLCVLSDAHTNAPALRMAMTLASRKLGRMSLTPPPMTDRSNEGAPVTEARKADGATAQRVMYRGRPVVS